MADDIRDHQEDNDSSRDLSRRDFVALSIAAGLAAATGTVAGAEVPITEKNVEVKTPDGTCEGLFIYPTSGSHPAVLIWPDAFGLRASMREIGRHVAGEGYAVLIPNPFYRVARATVDKPVLDAKTFNFADQNDMAKLKPLMGSATASGNAEKDAVAFIAFLDAQPQVDKTKKVGTQGYCMGGPLVVRTAAAVPNRVGAGASFHGGGLVTASPESPHLLAPKIKAHLYIAIAANDDSRQPDAKDKLKEAFAAAKVPAEIEVYSGAQHGWCVSDMPAGQNGAIYNKPDADKAMTKLVALYKSALV